ncbi:MAG: hypothetical protein AB8B85_03815 [Paracoccaceae bacterium]
MKNVNEQSTSIGANGAAKVWSEPTLEKVEMNTTAAGVAPQGSQESLFPLFPAS